jgi:arylsulfatase A-like enzyme
MQGRSFWGDLTDPAGAQHDRDRESEGFYYRYWMHDDRSHQVGAHYGYRTHRYTLIFFYNDGLGLPGCSDRRFAQEWELYDLEADPEELVNVADDPAYAAVRDDLEARMWLAQRDVGDVPHPGQPVPRLIREGGNLG